MVWCNSHHSLFNVVDLLAGSIVGWIAVDEAGRVGTWGTDAALEADIIAAGIECRV